MCGVYTVHPCLHPCLQQFTQTVPFLETLHYFHYLHNLYVASNSISSHPEWLVSFLIVTISVFTTCPAGYTILEEKERPQDLMVIGAPYLGPQLTLDVGFR